MNNINEFKVKIKSYIIIKDAYLFAKIIIFQHVTDRKE